jgi:hypothetical protein
MKTQQKKEQFINMFMQGLDDPIFEKILRIVTLGEPETELDELVEQQRKEMEAYISKFELSAVEDTIVPEEEIVEKEREANKSVYIVENQKQDGENTSEPTSIEGHTDVPSQLPVDDGVSS